MTHTTVGALRPARIIMNGQARIHTEYGIKTAKGVAELIAEESGLGELVEAARIFLFAVEGGEDIMTRKEATLTNVNLHIAIARVTGDEQALAKAQKALARVTEEETSA
jgi:hypothetical protein